MPKQVLTARVEEGQLEALEHIAQERGLNVGQLVRGWIESQLAQTDVEVSLEALYELRASLDRRIAQKEADRLAEIKANQKPPDLVLVEIGGGTWMSVERAEAIAKGIPFQERKH